MIPWKYSKTMKYPNNNKKTAKFLAKTVLDLVGVDKSIDSTFCELFGGLGYVSRELKPYVKNIIINDIEVYSSMINTAYMSVWIPRHIEKLLMSLNKNIGFKTGLIYKYYSSEGKITTPCFSPENAMKIDTIRTQITAWHKLGVINFDSYCYLLTSLLEASVRVANIQHTFDSFNSPIHKRMYLPLELLPLDRKDDSGNFHIQRSCAKDYINKIEGDVLFLNPPKSGCNYHINYHVLNTICLYPKVEQVEMFGKFNKINYKFKHTPFHTKRKYLENMEFILANAKFKYIILDCNKEICEPLHPILSKYGEFSILEHLYNIRVRDVARYRLKTTSQKHSYFYLLEKKGY